MPRFALIDADGNVIRIDDFIPSGEKLKPDDPVGKDWRFLALEDVKPDYDKETHNRAGDPTITVEAGQVRREWVVSEKTAEEKDAFKNERVKEQLDNAPVAQAVIAWVATKLSIAPQTAVDEIKALLK